MTVSVPLLALIPTGSLVIGLILGWLVRGARNSDGLTARDWRLRLAARDRDLQAAEERMAALVSAVGGLDGDISAADRLIALDEELRDADEELDRLRALEIDKNPASGSISRRLEELEVELATLESMRCPEPAAHRRDRVASGGDRSDAGP